MDPKEMFFEERDAIVNTLQSLTPEQWEQPSLCEGWSVRDVVGHMTSGLNISVPGVLLRTARSGFSITKASFKAAKETATQPTTQLVSTLKQTSKLTGFVKTIGYAKLVPDVTIHHEDIRRPLGMPYHQVPPERMAFSLSQLRKDTGPLKAKRRSTGVRMVATDIDWADGDGPEIRGAAMDLLLAMGGRRAVYGDLSGDGVAVLAAR